MVALKGCMLVLVTLCLAGFSTVAADANRRLLGNGGNGGAGGAGGAANGVGSVAGNGGGGGAGGFASGTGTGGNGGGGGKGGGAIGYGSVAGNGGGGGAGGGSAFGNGGNGGAGGVGGDAFGYYSSAGNGGTGGAGGASYTGKVIALPKCVIVSPVTKKVVTCISVTTIIKKKVTVTVLLPIQKTITVSGSVAYDTSSIALGGVSISSFGTTPVVISGVSHYPCTFLIPQKLFFKAKLTLTGTILVQQTKTYKFKSTIKVCKSNK